MKQRRSCSECGHHWAWLLNDGRFKCRRCKRVYTWRSVWDTCRLDERDKGRLLEFFVLGVPAYRARFRAPCSRSVFAFRVRVPQPSDSTARFVR